MTLRFACRMWARSIVLHIINLRSNPALRFYYRPLPYRALIFLCLPALLFLVPAGNTARAQIEFNKRTVSSVFEGVHALQVVDIDKDGDQDMVGASVDAIILWKNTDGNQSAWLADTVSNTFDGARFVDAADIDGDGDLDLFGAARGIDAVRWWENSTGLGTEWIEHSVDEEFDFAIHVFAIDLDGDDDKDLLGAAFKDNAITWWENTDGAGTAWTKYIVDDTFTGARHVCVVDLDVDGDLDIIGSADLASTVAWWENTGPNPEEWTKHIVDDSFNGINSVFPSDINGDNIPDLLGVADNADEIAWWQNAPNDSVSWKRNSIDSEFDGAVSTFPIDLDKDGDIDVVGAAALDNKVTWWENTGGNGLIWEEHDIDTEFQKPSFVIAADIDNDGDTDILGGNLLDTEFDVGEVAWWENKTIELPVELVSFDGILNGSILHLRWETLTETNNAGFEVQHRIASLGTESWQFQAFIEGAGNTFTPQTYSYTLDNLSPGHHQVRLKQVDFDGTISYSSIVSIHIATGERLEVSPPYPNPFNPQTQFSVTVNVPQRVRISVYNSLGQRVMEVHDGILGASERHQFDILADDLPGGLYLIHAVGEHFSDTRQAMLIK